MDTSRIDEWWYKEYNCKICGGFSHRRWAIDRKVCKSCMVKLVESYKKEVSDEYEFDEYVETMLILSTLTKD